MLRKRSGQLALTVGIWLLLVLVGTALASPGNITLASTSDSGVKGNNDSSSPSLSADVTDSFERVAEALQQVGLRADRIVEAVGLEGLAAVDNQGR